MKFKLDENLPSTLVPMFNGAGQEAETVLQEGLSGASDNQLFRKCCAEERVLVSLDLDFANPIRFPSKGSEGIVVLRPPRATQPLLRTLVEEMLTALAQESPRQRLWIVEIGRIRVLDPTDTPEAEPV